MAVAPPWDPGLQNERTHLAWVRTTLALLAGTLLLARVAAGTSAALSSAMDVLGLLAGATGWVLAAARFRHTQDALYGRRRMPGGALPLVVVAQFLILGIGATAYVLLG